eukprot:scaffold262697_cov32-Tisochrysis_lutea.AAC.1
MYSFSFRGSNLANPASVIEEFIERKKQRRLEIQDIERYFGQPRPDTTLYDDAQIVLEMVSQGWHIEHLPRYDTILGFLAKNTM